MAAALTIAILFALSFVVVRVGSVAMRLTGLPENVARLQCLSALTGTGYTTSESEMIVNYPIRRRILGILMVAGNLGLASVAATLIVSLVDTAPRAGAIAWQVVLMAIAITITVIIMNNKLVDRAMCGLIGKILLKTSALGTRPFHRLLQVETGYSVSEFQYCGCDTTTIADMPSSIRSLTLLAIRGPSGHRSRDLSDTTPILPGDHLICYGHDDLHRGFADELAQLT